MTGSSPEHPEFLLKRLVNRRRGLARLASVATAVTLAATVTGTAVANTPATSGPAQKTTPRAAKAAYRATPTAPFFFLSGILPSGQMYAYMPDGKGGFDDRSGAYSWPGFKYGVAIDPDLTGYQDGSYHVMTDGVVNLWRDGKLKKVATGWQQYTSVLAPGALAAGGAHPDVLARDKQGVLWRFPTKADGTFAPRVRVGPGWNQFTQITGVGDYTGDNKPDIVARDKQGVLWLYEGTGDGNKPFAPRTRIGPAWNQFDKLIATGDVDADHHSDLLARDPKGGLWLYKGTGKASAPFKPRVKIGTGFQQYRELF